jgi:hypothetical protein
LPRDAAPVSLQENIVAALLFDDRAGAAISAQVKPALFDENYREIAERALWYRRKYNRAPGLAHLDDLFGKLLQPGRAPRLRRLVFELAEHSRNINGDYVVASTQEFIREQTIKQALVNANSRYEMGGENLADDVEGILSAALRFRSQTLEAGTFLNDAGRSLKFLDRKENGIPFGINVFDPFGLALYPGEQTLFIAPPKSGKSWFCVHVGAIALLLRYRVLHIALEMGEPQVAGRYYQRFWTAGARPTPYNKTILEFERIGRGGNEKRFIGLKTRKGLMPRWSFSERGSKTELLKRIKQWGTKLDRLVIKAFPSGYLTMSMLEGYLDYLEMQHKFIPNLLIIDYPDLMAQDSDNFRISISRTFVNLRGLCGKRGIALFTPTQGNRGAMNSKRTRSGDVSEDISKVFTADNVITYQRTDDEKMYGLARLLLENARDVADGAEALITQSYATGQFCLESTLMNAKVYWESLAEVTGEAERQRIREARNNDE